MKTEIRGPYRLVDDLYLRKKASDTSDPVHVFYEAMLTSLTYEAYFAKVGHLEVMKPNFKENPVSARDEILYCRRNKRIEDG
jgi:hypothetical protein